jgi:hypothetical protein
LSDIKDSQKQEKLYEISSCIVAGQYIKKLLITSLIPVKERDSRFSALRLPISEGISARELLKLRSKLVRFGNSRWSFSSSRLEFSDLNWNQ